MRFFFVITELKRTYDVEYIEDSCDKNYNLTFKTFNINLSRQHIHKKRTKNQIIKIDINYPSILIKTHNNLIKKYFNVQWFRIRYFTV